MSPQILVWGNPTLILGDSSLNNTLITTPPDQHSSPSNSCTDLDGFPDVDERVFHDIVELVESTHFLHEDRIHALFVLGRVSPESRLSVEGLRQLIEDVVSHFVHNLVGRFPTTRGRFSLQHTNRAELTHNAMAGSLFCTLGQIQNSLKCEGIL